MEIELSRAHTELSLEAIDREKEQMKGMKAEK